jgi:hypothetical protein
MARFRVALLLLLGALIVVGGCATRPVNPRITEYVPNHGYQYEKRALHAPRDPQNLDKALRSTGWGRFLNRPSSSGY